MNRSTATRIVSNGTTGGLSAETVAVHSVPCRVRVENGVRKAAVNSYFTSSIRNDAENGLTASLRGRPLKGLELQLPPGYAGVVLAVTGNSVHQESRELSVTGRISGLHYWSLGATPTTADRLPQALAWTHIAQALHSPLPVDDSG